MVVVVVVFVLFCFVVDAVFPEEVSRCNPS